MDWLCKGEDFYNSTEFFSEEVPNFSNCFNKVVFRLTPCFVLWLFAGPYMFYDWPHRKPFPRSKFYKIRQVLLVVLALLALSELVYELVEAKTNVTPPIDYIAPLIVFITMTLGFMVMLFDQKKGILSSNLLSIFWVVTLLCWVLYFFNEINEIKTNQDNQLAVFSAVVFFISFGIIVIEIILSAFVEKPTSNVKKAEVANNKEEIPLTESYEDNEYKNSECPEMYSSFYSQLSFHWFTSMARLGNKRPLEKSDLWLLNPTDKCEVVVQTFLKNWKEEVNKCKLHNHQSNNLKSEIKTSNEKFAEEESFVPEVEYSKNNSDKKKMPSLPKVLFRSFGAFFSLSIVLKLAQDALAFTGPQLLKYLIAFVGDDQAPQWKGYLIAVGLFVTASIQTIFLQNYFHVCFTVGMRVRSSIVSAVYRKAIKLSNNARKGSTVGEIVNLMSVDAQRLLDLVSYMNVTWSGPLQIFLAIFFLWQQLGASTLAGVGVMLLLIPLNGVMASKAKKIHVKQLEFKDQRIKVTNEVLNGMKALKMYAWEINYQERLANIREKELTQLKKAAWLNAFISFTFVCAPFLVSFVTFAVYVLIDEKNVLTAEKTFVSLSLFHLMRFPLLMLPNVISSLIQATVSIKRLRNFLCNDEIDLKAVERSSSQHNNSNAIKIVDANFKWSKDDNDDILKDVSIEVKRGKLVAIVGQVGCGKSSLISAILGDMEKQKGSVSVNGNVAYVAQQSWIQNLTVQDNILFGKKMKADVYKRILKKCELQSDLNILPAGDLTEIGERGINLSGGQKQRVSIARAIFQDADIYLFDDPLSAVDSHVGKKIFDNVIGPNGMLKEKTRVLVTHGINFLPEVDQIIVLSQGKISEMGSYKELLQKDGDFSDFIKNHTYTEDENPDDSNKQYKSKITMRSKNEKNDDEQNLEKISSINSLTKEHKEKNTEKTQNKNKIYAEEKAEIGNVSLSIYKTYIRAVGVVISFTIIFTYFLQNTASVSSNIWLSIWTEDPIDPVTGTRNNTLSRLAVYGSLGFAQSAFSLCGAIMLYLNGLNAAKTIHNRMIDRLIHSPMAFFDVTPSGRIINRCGKDTDIMDDLLIRSISSVLSTIWRVMATVFVICYATYWFIIALVPISVVYYFIQRFYVKTSRQLKRLQSVSRSPIFSHFSETLTGSSTIRAYSRQGYFIKQNENKVDSNQMSYYPNIVSNRWLAFRLEMLTNCIILLACVFAVLGKGMVTESIVGLSVSYAMQVTQTFNWMVRQTSELENNIVSVERVEEYCNVDQEAAYHTSESLPEGWPSKGEVEFVNYSTKYRPDLDLVVKDISFKVSSGEKIGIVGRTGAGKSSLTLALFRIIEATEGKIMIDGVDINKVGLLDLRSKLAVIPQEPVLFSGTLRANLDPFDAFSDDDIWQTLRYSHLHDFVTSLPNKLMHVISEGGENLSVGQRQLVCLGRALLRNSKILVLDEATAAVDLETDDLIQKTIRDFFKEATTFTIAHRLNTIMDSTRIMVLDEGKIAEFDTPENLLKNKSGLFYNMAVNAGIV